MCVNDKGGIYSLAGFAYQIKVFILYILQLKPGCILEYETIDDVALKKITANQIDEYDEQVCSVLVSDTKTAIQVKKTKVTETVAKRVIKNWILVDKKHKPIDEFVLITDKEVDSDVLKKINASEIYDEVIATTEKKSLDAKLKAIGYTKNEFESKVADIVSKSTVQQSPNIDEKIEEDFSGYFIKLGVSEATYILRIKQLIEQITVEILESVMKGNAYELTYDEACGIQNRIITQITDEKWEPNYSQFKKLKKVDLNDLSITKSREYKQLKECKSLTNQDIARHLQYSEYYANSKRSYFERGMNNIVDDLENTAYENFCDAKTELINDSKDTPDYRLIETKKKSNSKAADEQIKYGVCINLTSEDTDVDIQISWKDD